ncbi:MAG TPA: hypothetical protein DD827_09500 [Gammaproteobacteria bacterium]|nr:hypothetical protein [Gammaproteobacteria bacterium]
MDLQSQNVSRRTRSPSGSAVVVLARRANGWLEWKYKDGKTLDEVKRQSDS